MNILFQEKKCHEFLDIKSFKMAQYPLKGGEFFQYSNHLLRHYFFLFPGLDAYHLAGLGVEIGVEFLIVEKILLFFPFSQPILSGG